MGGRRCLFSRTPAYAKVDSTSEDAAIEQFSQIAFLDITASRQSLLELLAAFVGVGILTLLVMLGISTLFAKRAVAPIEQSYRKQKQFVQDASHELKTSLASIIQTQEEPLKSACGVREKMQSLRFPIQEKESHGSI